MDREALIAEMKEARQELEAAEAVVERARARRDSAIFQARQAGISLDDVRAASGVSMRGVYLAQQRAANHK